MGFLSKLLGSKPEAAKPSQHQKPKKAKVPHQPPKPESNWEAATCKGVHKHGFTFLKREGQPDIYVHAETLEKFGMKNLQEGQMVQVKWGTTPKGLEAVELRRS